jgi:hypothetical protein
MTEVVVVVEAMGLEMAELLEAGVEDVIPRVAANLFACE